MKLYEITEQFKKIEAAFMESGGEVTEEIQGMLNQHEGDLYYKVDNYCKFIRNLEAENLGLKDEIDRLQKRMKANEGVIKSLKHNLLYNLKAMDQDKVETPLFKVWRQKSSPRLEIVNINWIPDDYKIAKLNLTLEELPESLRERAVIDVDKAKLKEDCKAAGGLADDNGQIYAELISDEHLRIK